MSIAWRLAGAVRRTWWAAKREQTKAMRRRCREKETATAPLLPPTPRTPQAMLAVLTSPVCACAQPLGMLGQTHVSGEMLEGMLASQS